MFTSLALAVAVVGAPTPLRLAADVDDAWSPLVNPAGLGFGVGGELRLLVGHTLEGRGTDLAIAGATTLGPYLAVGGGLVWNALGDGARFEPYVAAAIGPERLKLGVSWLTTGAGGVNAVALGVTYRPAAWLSASAATLDLTAARGARPYDLGLATRLLDERLLVSLRWRFVEGQAIAWDRDRPSIAGLVAIEPLPGVVVGVESDLHFEPSLSVQLAFERMAMGGFARGLGADGSPTLGVEVAAFARDLPSVLRPKRLAVLDLEGDLAPSPRFSLAAFALTRGVDFAAPLLLEAIERSPDVAGVVVRLGALELPWGRVAELRDGLVAIRAAGKRVECVLGSARDQELYLASACSRVALLAPVQVRLDGVSATSLFVGEALDRLGVAPQVARRGDYKTAPETFTRGGMSPAQREVTEHVVRTAYEAVIRAIVDGRHLPRERVEALVDEGTLTGERAQAEGLVDALVFPDEIEGWIEKGSADPLGFVSAASLPRPRRSRWGVAPTIAIVAVDDTITSGASRSLPLGLGGEAGAETIIQALDEAERDDDVKAVVLRVDSPGGDALASELIARRVARLAKVKPVIASLGGVAASGGYYVAAPATLILAEPTTITGSIGVFNLGFSVEGLARSLGVHAETVQRGVGAARGGLLRDATPEERAMTEREVEALYQRFLRTVEAGRRLKPEQLAPLAAGRVWTGTQAVDRGLVDALGGLDDALSRARIAAGLEPDARYVVRVLPAARDVLPVAASDRPADALETLGGSLARWVAPWAAARSPVDVLLATLPPAVRPLARAWARVVSAGAASRPVALWPTALEVD